MVLGFGLALALALVARLFNKDFIVVLVNTYCCAVW